MAIPDYQSCMLPVLEILADRQEHTMREVTDQVAERFKLSKEDREQLLESGQQTVIGNRVAWAKTYLKKAGLLQNPSRGKIQISDAGLQLLKQNPKAVDTQFLKQYPAFLAFFQQKNARRADEQPAAKTETPDEVIDAAYQELRGALADDLLERVKSCSPRFFEQLVVKLLVAMGYGGSLADAGQAVGRTGDGGIDGIIKEDKLGLDVLCIQAKRWDGPVGRPVVQAFAGSMEGFRARKGVLITTSAFTRDAEDYVTKIGSRIILLDGRRLAELMIDHNIGVTAARSYTIKKPDTDFFVEDEG